MSVATSRLHAGARNTTGSAVTATGFISLSTELWQVFQCMHKFVFCKFSGSTSSPFINSLFCLCLPCGRTECKHTARRSIIYASKLADNILLRMQGTSYVNIVPFPSLSREPRRQLFILPDQWGNIMDMSNLHVKNNEA